MSSPPQTPTHPPNSSHRRHPSSLDLQTPSRQYSLSRRSSGYSPVTPRSTHDFEHSSPAQNFGNSIGAGGSGLGNLADELADAYSDEEGGWEGEEGEEDMGLGDAGGIGIAVEHDGTAGINGNGVRDSGVAMDSSPSAESKATLSPLRGAGGSKHRRQKSRYDGSDYGDDSDLEASEGISAGLEARMAAVESLVRRGMETNGSESDGVVKRVTERLRDLGSQAGVESGATRLKTAHDSLSTHLSHQTRTLSSISSSLLSPLAIPPDPETIDALLPLITTTLELLPHPSPEPFYALSQLTISTRELLQHLSVVSDSLHMSRQDASTAARRLRSAKEQLADWKRDTELREQGVRFLEKGDWDNRLREREAERVCEDVVNGFEEVCGQWRKRLCEGLGVASA